MNRHFFLFFLFFSLITGRVFAQDDLDAMVKMSLEELLNLSVISATKTEQKISEAPAIISIITQQQIKERGYRTVGEALQSVTGFDLLHDRFQYNLGVRGINGGLRAWSRIVKVMIDGQPVSYRPSSENFLGRELIPLSVIERIEIVRGPASALYGSNAFLGVINIITRKNEQKNWSEITADLGSSKYLSSFTTDVTLGGVSGNLNYIAAGSFSRSDQSGVGPVNVPGSLKYGADDISKNDISRPRSIFAGLNYDNEGVGQLSLQFNYQRLDSYAEFQDWGVLTHDNRIDIGNYYLRGKFSRQFTDKLAGTFSLAYAQGQPGSKERLDTDADPTVWITRDVGYKGIDVAAEFAYSLSESNNISFGLDHTTDMQNLQTHYINSPGSPKSPIQGVRYGDKNFLNTGVYVQTILYPTSAFGVTAGLRYDDHNIYGDVVNYRLAGVYQISESIHAKLLYGTSYKAPSSVQLFSNYVVTRGVVGNPDLKPEKAKTVEAAVGMRLGKHFNINLNVFYNTINDKVELVLPVGSVSNTKPDNLAKINSNGIEFETQYNLVKLQSYANFTYQKSHIEKMHPVRGKVVLNTALYPSYTFKFGINYKIPSYFLNFNCEGRLTGARLASEFNSYIFDPVDYRTNRYELDSYFLMDLTLSTDNLSIFDKRETTISLKIYNLFDKQYAFPGYKDFDIPGFERTIYINLSQRF